MSKKKIGKSNKGTTMEHYISFLVKGSKKDVTEYCKNL